MVHIIDDNYDVNIEDSICTSYKELVEFVKKKTGFDLYSKNPQKGIKELKMQIDAVEIFADSLSEAIAEIQRKLEVECNSETHSFMEWVDANKFMAKCKVVQEEYTEGYEEDDDDSDWKREQAMHAGMAFGCNGYNDFWGY